MSATDDKRYTTAQYLTQAQKSIDKFEFEIAFQILKRSFEQDANSVVAFRIATCLQEMAATQDSKELVLLSNGQQENVREWLEKALLGLDGGQKERLEDSVSRWQINLSLAQLSVERKAVEYYERSVDELERILAEDIGGDSRNTLIRHLSTALCALCEIYMTDCCDAPEAESKCVEYITKAQQVDAHNPEVFSTLASILLSRCMPSQAREALAQNLNLWYIDPHTQQEEEGQVDLAAFSSSWPSFDARLVVAKLLVEVGEYRRAVGVVETLFVENDEWWEVWYLFGICYMRMAEMGGREDYDNVDANGCMMAVDGQDEDAFLESDVEALLGDAKECFEKIIQLNEKFLAMDKDPLDPSIIDEAQELLKEVQTLADSVSAQ